MTTGKATCVQRLLARDSDTALPLCVSLPVVGTARHRLLQRARPGGSTRCPGGAGSVRSGGPILAAILTPGLSRPVPSPSLSHCPFSRFLPLQTLWGSQSTQFLMYVLGPPYPLLTPSLLPPFLRGRTCIIQGLSWPFVCKSFPFPPSISCTPSPLSHLPLASPSSASSFCLFSLYLPHTLSIFSFHSFLLLLSSLLHTFRQ